MSRPPVPYPMTDDAFEWVAVVDEDWTTNVAGATLARVCRYCRVNEGVAVLFRGRRRTRPYLYCAEHMYGRWVEDGRVMSWRLRAVTA